MRNLKLDELGNDRWSLQALWQAHVLITGYSFQGCLVLTNHKHNIVSTRKSAMAWCPQKAPYQSAGGREPTARRSSRLTRGAICSSVDVRGQHSGCLARASAELPGFQEKASLVASSPNDPEVPTSLALVDLVWDYTLNLAVLLELPKRLNGVYVAVLSRAQQSEELVPRESR